ncbi:hypothetical protein ON010_g10609 [Phytophthora cinnamomi]|nr:hypothetical protein ON010_g10609 [Phytophthora cinnamomi]
MVAISLGSAEVGGKMIVQKVEDQLLDSWVPQSADEVFKRLKLDTAGNYVFKYPRLSTWILYVTKEEGKQADEKMYTVLRGAYGDDELAVMLAGSKKYLAGDVAKRLEEIQQTVFLSEGKNAKAMFATLKLNTHGNQLFESPGFSTWTSYYLGWMRRTR